jgi:hypothetical protein
MSYPFVLGEVNIFIMFIGTCNAPLMKNLRITFNILNLVTHGMQTP